MNTPKNPGLPLGPNLADHQSVWAEALRAVAATWRARAEAGRPDAAEVLKLAGLFEDAASLLQGLPAPPKDTGAPAVEEELRQSQEPSPLTNAGLEQLVQERTGELAALNAELDAFSFSVSHDLRAPLRAIDGFSKVLLEDYGSGRPLDEQARHYLHRINSGAHRMTSLIDALLKLSRITRTELHRGPVDLAEIARDVVVLLKQQSPGRDVAVSLPPAAPASGDPRLLRVLLENLLGNAWKFTSKTPNPSIELGIEERDGERAFFVRDNGAGFEMAYASKLFTPFQRLHDEDEFEGSGVGLAAAQRVVRRHGGRIWAEAEPGRGATFWFTLGEA